MTIAADPKRLGEDRLSSIKWIYVCPVITFAKLRNLHILDVISTDLTKMTIDEGVLCTAISWMRN